MYLLYKRNRGTMYENGKKIKDLRVKNNLTQIDLAERLNVTPQAVSRWELDIVEPGLDTMRDMANLFGIDLDYCGVIIGKDITYENGKIIFHKDAHPRSDQAGIRTANDINAETWIKNTYYVLLTRGILGTFVYCEDDSLREYLKGKLITK